MSCGCGGECCGQPKGLGFLSLPESGGGYGDFWGFDDSFWGGGGGGDFWGFGDPFWNGGSDFWGFGNSYWDGYFDPSTNTFRFFDSDTFLPNSTGNYGTPNWNWQGLLDWWRDLTTPRPIPPISPDPNTSTLPPFSGYCPPNTYCADFPTCSQCVPLNETPAQKARRLAEQSAKAAAQKAQQQRQQAQQCPPNTGLVKNAQGQCVCPPGYAPNAQLKKCVLVNASLAAQSQQSPDWLKWALLAGLAVLVVKR